MAWINWQLNPAFMARHFMTSLHHIREGRWYTIVTTCFSHRDPIHLLGNMVTLYFFWNRVFSGRLVIHSATGFKVNARYVDTTVLFRSVPIQSPDAGMRRMHARRLRGAET